MEKTVLILPDGSRISSGPGESCAVQSLQLTQTVNSGTELTLGSVCAAMAELKIWGEPAINAGEEFRIIRENGDNTQNLGIFIAEKPVRTQGCVKLTAYDRVSLLDKDLTQWLSQLDGWPYRLTDFAQQVCQACGLTLIDAALPNGEYAVDRFTAKGITGRKLLQWVGQITGRFCRATPAGQMEFAWYAPAELEIAPTGENFYYSGTLQLSDYQVQPVEKVHLQATDSDVGTLWPADMAGAVNTYTITGNYLLTAPGADTLKPIAQTLFQQLAEVSYTPCQLRVASACPVQAGQVVTLRDRGGSNYRVYVMKLVLSGNGKTLYCTGSQNRLTSTAVNETSVQALSGKVTELSLTVDGVKAENRDAQGNLARISMALEGIDARVSSQQTGLTGIKESLTQLKQTADQLEVAVQTVETQGVSRVQTQTGYCFDQNGLSIHRTGSQMENLLDDTGMYVNRSGSLVLRANDEGVAAVDVTVKNYLIMGEHARFEDYNNGRTACFWI